MNAALLLLWLAGRVAPASAHGWGGGGGGYGGGGDSSDTDDRRYSRRHAPQPMATAPGSYSPPPAAAPPAESVVPTRYAEPTAPRETSGGEPPRGTRRHSHRAPDHSAAARAAGPSADRSRRESTENAVKVVYWHGDGGARYAHYFDGKAHWYGFYDGPRFYWTRYAADRWWWYDAAVSRWLYWHDGYWWWQDPSAPGTAYLDIDDNLYAYASTPAAVDGGTVPTAAPGAAPADAPAAVQAAPAAAKGAAGDRAAVSPDGTRLVQVYGDRREAFLYDRSGAEPRFLAYLAPSVQRVRFSSPQPGQPFEIMLVMDDGTFELFDADGKPDLAPPAAAGDAPTDAAPPAEVLQAPDAPPAPHG